MLLARIVGLLLCLGAGASLVLWILTGQPRYRAWAWNIIRVGVVLVFIILALFALERVLVAADFPPARYAGTAGLMRLPASA